MQKALKEFNDVINSCQEKNAKLPPGEMKYYLFILINSIKTKQNEMTVKFLNELSTLLDNLNQLHTKNTLDATLLDKIVKNYEQLQTIAQVNTFTAYTKLVLIQVGSTITSLVCGLIGGVIGGVAGFFRNIWNLSNPLKGLGIGLLTGFAIGAIAGFRAPKKLFKDELIRQLQFGLNSLQISIDNLRQSLMKNNEKIKLFDIYFEEAKSRIRHECFNSDAEFEAFLNTDITYEINSFKAGFIGGTLLHGFVGQHFYIVIPINQNKPKEKNYLIEFSPEPSDINEKPDQQETRTVKGIKIVEMLATYNKLQETAACTMSYIVRHTKPGDNDCATLVNKILLATNQPAAKISRVAKVNQVGQAIGFFAAKVSPFPQDFFNTPEAGLTGK